MSSSSSSFDPRSPNTSPECRRVIRLCAKIEELIYEDMEGDVEEFLTNLRSVFLVFCGHLHTDVDHLEYYSNGEIPETYTETHQKIEEMYNQLRRRVGICHTTLVFEQKRDWFSQSPEDKPENEIFPDQPSM